MASILRTGNRWQARVRRKGYPTETKTFATKTEALHWSQIIESDMNKGLYISRTGAERTTFIEILDRYMQEVTPHKRGADEELIRLNAMKRHKMCKSSMVAMTPTVLGGYRDQRLKVCAPSTVVRDLGMLSSVFNHCIREWRMPIIYPVTCIRKPSLPSGRDRTLSVDEEQRLIE